MFAEFIQQWLDATAKVKVGLVIGIVAIVALTLGLWFWLGQEDYQVLFADLEPRDASAIVDALDNMKVSYRLDEGGAKVLVPQNEVYPVRLKLMGKDLPLNGSVGFEIFDRSDYGMTEYAQRINYQRALQGELARTIASANAIKFARVHLVLPQNGLFDQGREDAKASVSLVLKPGERLAAEQIMGIQRLVSAAVPGMEVGKVTVLDQNGVALTRNDGDDALASVSERLSLKKEVEDYFSRKLVGILDRSFGPGKAIVNVDVTLDMDQVRTTNENVIPAIKAGGEASGAVIRKKVTTQDAGSAVPAPPADGQVAAYPETRKKGSNSSSDTEYQLGRSVEQIISTPGGIKRISVGVVVPASLAKEQIDKLREVLSAVVGLNGVRGDTIAIRALQDFGQADALADIGGREMTGSAAPDESRLSAGRREGAERYFKTPVVVLVILVASALVGFMFAGRLILRRRACAVPTPLKLSPYDRELVLAHIKDILRPERNSAGEVVQ